MRPTGEAAKMTLRIEPLTPERWPAFEELMGRAGPCSRCWCMYWRVGPSYRRQTGEANRKALHTIACDGPPPGLVAFHKQLAVGWCQLTPREALPWLDNTKKLQRIDDAAVWSISCFFIRQGWRRRGVATALTHAAIDAARHAGAPALEAYPLDAAQSSSTSFTGYASTFQRAGFRIVARHTEARPMMRIEFGARKRRSSVQ